MTDISGAMEAFGEPNEQLINLARHLVDNPQPLQSPTQVRQLCETLLALHARASRPQRDGEGNRGLDAAASPVDPWQPISTAPKDGTRIIIAWGGVTTTGKYLDNSKAPYMPWAGWVPVSGDPWPAGKPTHWMPLPAPPGADANQQRKTEEKS